MKLAHVFKMAVVVNFEAEDVQFIEVEVDSGGYRINCSLLGTPSQSQACSRYLLNER